MLISLLISAVLLPAHAQQTKQNSETARSIILHLLEGRTFEKSSCSTRKQDIFCDGLIETLQAGNFEVVPATEWSDRPDMPTYVEARKQCKNLDLEDDQIQRGPTIKAIKDFTLYKIEPSPRPGKSVWVFYARDYAMWGGEIILHDDGTPWIMLSGYFQAFELPGCKRLEVSITHDAFGGGYGRGNPFVTERDWINALIKTHGRYGTLSIYPILRDTTPRECWWYSVEYWNWGPRLADREIYGFGYKPSNCPAE